MMHSYLEAEDTTLKKILTIQSTNHFGMPDNDPISLGRVKPTL